jgi:hypothetical protein
MNTVEIAEKRMDRLYELLELGLTIDGGHHKQWALVQIAELFGIKVDDELKDEAIAP